MAPNSEIFPGLLNISAKFEEIPSTSKDAIGRQTCGAGGPFCENSSHMQTRLIPSTPEYSQPMISYMLVYHPKPLGPIISEL